MCIFLSSILSDSTSPVAIWNDTCAWLGLQDPSLLALPARRLQATFYSLLRKQWPNTANPARPKNLAKVQKKAEHGETSCSDFTPDLYK